MDTLTDRLDTTSVGKIITLPSTTNFESFAVSPEVRAFSSTGRQEPPIPIPGDNNTQNASVRAFSSTGRQEPPIPIPGDENQSAATLLTSTKKTKSSSFNPLATDVFSGNVQEIVQLLGSKDLHNLAFIITVAANTGGTLAFVVEVFSAQGDLLFKTHVSDPITPVKGEPLILSLNDEGLKEAATLALPGNYLSLSTETAAERHLISSVKLARIKQ